MKYFFIVFSLCVIYCFYNNKSFKSCPSFNTQESENAFVDFIEHGIEVGT